MYINVDQLTVRVNNTKTLTKKRRRSIVLACWQVTPARAFKRLPATLLDQSVSAVSLACLFAVSEFTSVQLVVQCERAWVNQRSKDCVLFSVILQQNIIKGISPVPRDK